VEVVENTDIWYTRLLATYLFSKMEFQGTSDGTNFELFYLNFGCDIKAIIYMLEQQRSGIGLVVPIAESNLLDCHALNSSVFERPRHEKRGRWAYQTVISRASALVLTSHCAALLLRF
jgi:hypothetical protein